MHTDQLAASTPTALQRAHAPCIAHHHTCAQSSILQYVPSWYIETLELAADGAGEGGTALAALGSGRVVLLSCTVGVSGTVLALRGALADLPLAGVATTRTWLGAHGLACV